MGKYRTKHFACGINLSKRLKFAATHLEITMTFFLTPFLEIAVYLCKVCTVHPLVEGLRKDFILRCNAYVICPYEKSKFLSSNLVACIIGEHCMNNNLILISCSWAW